MTNQEKISELLAQLFEVSMRINLETDMACFFDISGHVSQVSIKVNKDKKNYEKLTSHEMYYQRDWMEDRGEKEFITAATIALEDLNNILNAKWEKTYKAYCNLIDMSCSQTFTSEEAAKRWVSKMKEKSGLDLQSRM